MGVGSFLFQSRAGVEPRLAQPQIRKGNHLAPAQVLGGLGTSLLPYLTGQLCSIEGGRKDALGALSAVQRAGGKLAPRRKGGGAVGSSQLRWACGPRISESCRALFFQAFAP